MKNKETTCPVTKVALLLSDVWTMLIMHALLEGGAMRFCDLERALDGISTRTLTNKLKILEEEGLLIKNESGLYEATKRGKGLRLIENAMRRYEKQYLQV
jgi:DNA-binding HxlR family transcriptional regulator